MQKLLLIDGNAILHRAYHSLPPFKTQKGEVTNAIYGFLKMLFDILKKEKPDYLGIAWDRAAPTFRHEQYAEYKATRAAPPDDLYPQLPRLKEVLAALNIKMLEKDGYEADDILGTLSHHAAKYHEMVTLILTGDRDALQLVTTKTHVIAPIRGVSDVFIFTPESVKEKTGVHPNQIIDYKALCGDVSDNIPGVPGIGPKQAADLLQRYQTLDNVYNNINQLTSGQQKKLTEGKDSAYMSKDIATINLQAPIDTETKNLTIGDADYKRVSELFKELEFKSLNQKLDEIKKLISPSASSQADTNAQQSLF